VTAALASLTKAGLNAGHQGLGDRVRHPAGSGSRRVTWAPSVTAPPMHHRPRSRRFLAACTLSAGWGEVSDIVDAITYLETAGFVTGEILHVDGGVSAGALIR